MNRMSSQFDPEKAVEIILYIAARLNADRATFHTISKMCYFADLLHLERYGRLITADGYVAMKHGPVPSHIYDLLKKDDFKGLAAYTDGAFDLIDEYHVAPRRAVREDYLSASETECLEDTIAKYGRMSFKRLSEESHKGAWCEADANDFIRLNDMIGMLPESETVRQHVFGK